MDGNIEAMQLLLNTFFHRNDIIVKEVVTQKSANNLYGRSARFDVIAVDSDSKIYNCEIQRANEGANPKRARFNNSLIDSREINKGTKYKDFPEIWVIFITENDIFGAQLPMYHVERSVIELNKPFEDAAHIIYVNGEYRGDDDMGLLMHDFFCTDPSQDRDGTVSFDLVFSSNRNTGLSPDPLPLVFNLTGQCVNIAGTAFFTINDSLEHFFILLISPGTKKGRDRIIVLHQCGAATIYPGLSHLRTARAGKSVVINKGWAVRLRRSRAI